MRLLFDIETNGLPRKGMDRIHCIVVKDLDTGQVIRFNDQGTGRPITEGVNLLAEAKLLVGHNIVYFDLPVIQGIYPFFEYRNDVIDTLILSRLIYPDLLNRDFRRKPIGMPAKLYGRHSLEAWGYRLGEYKGSSPRPPTGPTGHRTWRTTASRTCMLVRSCSLFSNRE